MKKLFTLTLAAALIAGYAVNAKAEVELSGNITSIVGYQKSNDEAGAANVGGAITDGTVTGNAPAAEQDIYGVWLDQIELDGSFELGDNVGGRFDLDFADHSNNGNYLTGVEQGYITFNVPLGNGWAWSVGKMNSGVGLESIDRIDNTFVAYTPAWVYLVPKNVLGISGYYEFNDSLSLTLSVLNDFNLYDITAQETSAYPSGLVKLSWWGGDESNPNSVNLALGAGLEHAANNGQNTVGSTGINENEGLELYGNLWGQWVFNAFTVGYEGIVRGTSSVNDTFNSDMSLSYAGQISGKYAFSDVNSVQARYALHIENESAGDGASTTGGYWNNSFEGLTHQGTLGFTHMITDGAKVTAEYVFTMASNDPASTDGIYHNFLVGFGYSF